MNLLGFEKTKQLLVEYKIPFCESYLVSSKSEALKASKKIGFPVVLKIVSPDILHKTDIGAVKTGIENEQELEKSFQQILCSVKKKRPQAEIEGVLVQEQIQGTEVVIGMKKDRTFGPVLMFGLGGVLVEVLKDVAFRVAPITKTQGLEMIKEIKGFKVLKGFRGKKPVNLDTITEILVKVSNLSLKEKEIKEIDLNPVMVNEKRALVVDPRFLI